MANSDALRICWDNKIHEQKKRPFIPKLRRDRPAEPQVRTDNYQLGALLLVMLTGKYPNQGGIRLLENREDVAGGWPRIFNGVCERTGQSVFKAWQRKCDF